MANVKNYRKQGGDEWVVGGELNVASGGEAAVESGGELDIESGGALKIAGTQMSASAADLNSVVTTAGIWAKTLAAGNGYGSDYIKTDSGDDTLVADPEGDYDLILIVTVTEDFTDDAADDQTKIKIGKAAGTDEYMADTVLDDAEAGDQIIIQDSMASGNIVNVNVTAAQGGTASGAVNVMAFIKEQAA